MSRAVSCALVVLMLPGPAAGAAVASGQAPGRTGQSVTRDTARTGALRGEARDAKGRKMAGARVRARDAGTGAIAGEVLSDAVGGFAVTSLAPATYVVEVVSVAGQVVGLSPAIAVAAGTTATVTVTATAAGAIAAAAAGGGFSVLGLGTAASVGLAAAAGAAGVLGIVAAATTASPSR
jgi:hypothetical protein